MQVYATLPPAGTRQPTISQTLPALRSSSLIYSLRQYTHFADMLTSSSSRGSKEGRKEERKKGRGIGSRASGSPLSHPEQSSRSLARTSCFAGQPTSVYMLVAFALVFRSPLLWSMAGSALLGGGMALEPVCSRGIERAAAAAPPFLRVRI